MGRIAISPTAPQVLTRENVSMRIENRPTSAANQQRDFWFLFLVCYPFFLVAAVIERTFPARRTAVAAITGRRSVFAEASSIAYRTLPYAF